MSGQLVRVRHLETLEAMASVVRVDLVYEEPGVQVRRTVDLNSIAGEVILMHPDPAVVAADYAALRALQPTLFEVTESASRSYVVTFYVSRYREHAHLGCNGLAVHVLAVDCSLRPPPLGSVRKSLYALLTCISRLCRL